MSRVYNPLPRQRTAEVAEKIEWQSGVWRLVNDMIKRRNPVAVDLAKKHGLAMYDAKFRQILAEHVAQNM